MTVEELITFLKRFRPTRDHLVDIQVGRGWASLNVRNKEWKIQGTHDIPREKEDS